MQMEPITFTMEKGDKRELKGLARKMGLTQSALIRMVLREYIQRKRVVLAGL